MLQNSYDQSAADLRLVTTIFDWKLKNRGSQVKRIYEEVILVCDLKQYLLLF